MKLNSLGIQDNHNLQSVSAQARLLMSERRQKLQNRQQSMLYRAAQTGLDA
jgi:hypothetical protein